MHIDVSATAKWELSLDIRDDEGAVDMTDKTCVFVIVDPANVEICRAGSTGATGTIVAVAGPDDTGAIKSRLNVTIPTEEHVSLVVPRDYLFVEGELGVLDNSDWLWLGSVDLKVWAGPTWDITSDVTGATGV